jgi:hypothetical protein
MKPRRSIAALVLASALALSGCGSQAALTAAEEVPALSSALTKVDQDLAHHQYAAARRTLASLISETRAAQRDGTLSAAKADGIVSAARKLLAMLPRPTPASTPTPTPTPTPHEHRKHEEPKKHEDRRPKDHGDKESDQRLTAPASPTATPTSTPSPTTPPPSPSETASPAALTTPTP